MRNSLELDLMVETMKQVYMNVSCANFKVLEFEVLK